MGANTRSDSRFTLGEGRNGNRNSTRARQIYDAILGQNYVVSAGWYTGFIPSTLHELVEYMPSLTEWKITAGVWAFGLMIYTVALKVALPVLTGGHAHEAHEAERPAARAPDLDALAPKATAEPALPLG